MSEKQLDKISLGNQQVTNRTPIEGSSELGLPPNLVGAISELGTTGDTPADPPEAGTLKAVTNLRIKSQTVHFSPDGSQLVDIVIEWDDVAGASSYEIRVTKVA